MIYVGKESMELIIQQDKSYSPPEKVREARGRVLWLAAGGGVAQHDETNGNSTSTWSPVPGTTATQ